MGAVFIWLGGVITALFSTLFGWFAQVFTKRLAIVAAAVITITAVTAALFTSLAGLLGALSFSLPEAMTGPLGLFLPGNLHLCVSIILSAHLLRYAYDWNVRVIQYKLF